MKKILAMLMAFLMVLSFGACADTETEQPSESEQSSETETPVEESAAAEKVILMVSFGTSYNDSRALTIDAIEAAVAEAYPDWEVRRAFTAQTIIDKLATRDGTEIDNVTEAMDKLVADGVKEVVVQPTHIMNGFEYDDVVAEVTPYADQFDFFAVGDPLLTSEEDYEYVIDAVMSTIPEAGSTDTAVVFMGHGTEHYANATYSELEHMMHDEGYENVFVGTVEGYPTIDNVIAEVTAYGATKVVLYPFMVVAGDHANNDMAGDESDSWKTAFTNAGFEVECRIEGLGQNEAVQQRYLTHIQEAIDGGSYVIPQAAVVTPGECDPDKKAILVVSFGTSYNDSRALTIEAIEADVAAAFPDWEVRRAFTSQIIIDKLATRDGTEIDNVQQALESLIADGYGTVVVQPTHVMPGYEYDDIVADVNAYSGYFSKLVMGDPLLTTEEDYENVISAVMSTIPEAGSTDTAVVFMGHGTEHFANATYSELEYMLHAEGYENTFVGTVEGYPTIDNVIAAVTAYGANKVVLYPFMIVAGDHANNDMAGDEADSWKSAFEAAGFEVECKIQGLGQNEGVRTMEVEHLQATITDAGL
ncbi:MAG TPA: sirohydrochlorin cobaltochelatase [Oscillospiraceae bacterium]|nr:sirohydrochlorin cobaltochelatase [Oscillospiraceae bacterium]